MAITTTPIQQVDEVTNAMYDVNLLGQYHIFYPYSFSTAFSTPAVWFCIFHSHIFSRPKLY